MLRLLFVVDPALEEDAAVRSFPRRLRDEGHEVVHGGEVVEPDQVAAMAVQEDVDAVLVLDAVGGAQVAGRVAVLLHEGGAADIAVVPLGPETPPADLGDVVRRAVDSAADDGPAS